MKTLLHVTFPDKIQVKQVKKWEFSVDFRKQKRFSFAGEQFRRHFIIKLGVESQLRNRPRAKQKSGFWSRVIMGRHFFTQNGRNLHPCPSLQKKTRFARRDENVASASMYMSLCCCCYCLPGTMSGGIRCEIQDTTTKSPDGR